MKATSVRSIAVILLVAIAGFAQSVTREKPIPQDEVPEVILKALKADYPHARARTYTRVEVDGTPFFKIECVDRDIQRNLFYNPDGSLVEIEERITAAALPAESQQAIQEKYPKAQVTNAEKVIQGNQIGYKASVRKGDKLFHLEFDDSGKLTSALEVKVNIVIR